MVEDFLTFFLIIGICYLNIGLIYLQHVKKSNLSNFSLFCGVVEELRIDDITSKSF